MGKQKEKAKQKKGSQFVLRVEKEEKNQFIEICASLDSSAGREIRRFMREFVVQHSAAPVEVQPMPEATGAVGDQPEALPDQGAAEVEKKAKATKKAKKQTEAA